MRRAAPALLVPPKLLQHFAAVTVVITLLLAVFASGADWGAPAQLKKIEDRNQGFKAEAQKLGQTTLVNKLNIANRAGTARPSFDDANDVAPEITPAVPVYARGTQAGSGNVPPPVARIPGNVEFIPDLPQRPGASITVKGMNVDALPNAAPAKRKRKATEPYRAVTPPQFEAMKEASQPRPGEPGQ